MYERVICMVSITLSVPEELKQQMDKFEIINWSAVAREAIRKKLEMLNVLEEITKDSTITEEDALKWGREVNKKVAKRYLSARGK